MNLISTITYQYINWITVLSRFKDYEEYPIKYNLIIESLSISVQKMIWDEFDIKYVIR